MLNINMMKKELSIDKHTVLEGYITEYLYKKQFLANNPNAYTTGWWFVSGNEGKSQTMMFVLKNNPSALDKSIADILRSDYEIRQLKMYLNNSRQATNTHKESNDINIFFKSRGIYEKQQHGSPAKGIDTKRQAICIKKLMDLNLLEETYCSRRIAHLLSKYFYTVINFDFFCRATNGTIYNVEVKFKDDFPYGNKRYFGLNIGESKLFSKLNELGIPTLNVILYKNPYYHDDSIFQFLDRDIDHSWYRSIFNPAFLEGVANANAKTSLEGKRRQTYYRISREHFVSLRNKVPLTVSID